MWVESTPTRVDHDGHVDQACIRRYLEIYIAPNSHVAGTSLLTGTMSNEIECRVWLKLVPGKNS